MNNDLIPSLFGHTLPFRRLNSQTSGTPKTKISIYSTPNSFYSLDLLPEQPLQRGT